MSSVGVNNTFGFSFHTHTRAQTHTHTNKQSNTHTHTHKQYNKNSKLFHYSRIYIMFFKQMKKGYINSNLFSVHQFGQIDEIKNLCWTKKRTTLTIITNRRWYTNTYRKDTLLNINCGFKYFGAFPWLLVEHSNLSLLLLFYFKIKMGGCFLSYFWHLRVALTLWALSCFLS